MAIADAPAGRRTWGCALAVAAVAAAVYLPALRNPYVLDDALVESTAADRAHAPLSTLFDDSYFGRYNQDTYRPFVTLTTIVDHRVGLDPRLAAHLQNLLWHAATALLIVLFARRHLPLAAAAVAGLFFAVHPLTTEAVAGPGFREDAVVAALLVGALLLFQRRSAPARGCALVLYGLALFSKENAIVFPALFALKWLTLDRDESLDRHPFGAEIAAIVVVTLGYLVVRFRVMAPAQAFADPLGGTLAATWVAVPRIVAHDLRMLVVPHPLLAQYSHQFPLGASFASQVPWMLVDVAFVAGALALARRHALVSFGLLWYVVALVPVLHLVPLREETAIRFLHVSLVGGALAAAAVFERARHLRATPVVAAAALVSLLALTEVRLHTLRDEGLVWEDTLRHNPRAYLGHFYFAALREREGKVDGARRVWTRAIADCPRESAFGRRRFCAYFSTKLGFLLLRRRDVPAARAAFDEALAFAPGYAPAHVGLGHLDLAAGDVLGARRHVAEATREGPPAPAVVELVDELRARIDESSPRPGPMVR